MESFATLPHTLRGRLLGLPPLMPAAGSARAGWLPVSALYLLSVGYLALCLWLPDASVDPDQVELLPLAVVALALVALGLGRAFLSLVGYRTEAPVHPLMAVALFAPFGLGQCAALFGAIAVLQNAKQRGLLAPLAALLFWNLALWPWLLYANTQVYYRFVVEEGVTVLVDPALSTFVVLGAFILTTTTTSSLLWSWWRSRSLARKARALTQGAPSLMPGDAIVTGTVALAPGETQAVRLDIEQAGEEYQDSGDWVRWTEVERRLSVRPFYLQLEGGLWLRVEPSSNVRLMDDLHGAVLVDRRHRTRSAELTVGERVTAVGRLQWDRDAYGNSHWVLREPPGAPLLLASVPLETPFARHARTLGFTLSTCSVLHALVLGLLAVAYASWASGGLAAGPLSFFDPALAWIVMFGPAAIVALSLLGHALGSAPSWYEDPTVDDHESGHLVPGPEPAVIKKKARSAAPAQEMGGILGLLAVVFAACVVPAGIGIHYVSSRLGTKTVVGIDPGLLAAGQGELRIRSDFPIDTRLPPVVARRMAGVAAECRAAVPAEPLLVVLVFDDGGELHDVHLYGDFEHTAPAGPSRGVSERQACVRRVSTGLRIAWSPTQRYRLFAVEVKL